MIDFDVELSGVDRYTRNLLRDLMKEAKKAADRAVVKTAPIVVEDISNSLKRAYKHAVDDFYSDYSPSDYERTWSLYDMLEVNMAFHEDESGESGGGGRISGGYALNQNKMSGFRNWDGNGNNGLFDQVFLRGWHGGADHISEEKVHYPFQDHPEPGVPYYRYPRPYYRYWGKRAKILAPAPIERFDNYTDIEISGAIERGNKTLYDNVVEELDKISL